MRILSIGRQRLLRVKEKECARGIDRYGDNEQAQDDVHDGVSEMGLDERKGIVLQQSVACRLIRYIVIASSCDGEH